MQEIINNIELSPYQKSKNIDIYVIQQLIENTHENRKSYIFFIIKMAEKAIHITDKDKNEAIETKGTRIKQIHQKTGEKPIEHAWDAPMNEAEGKCHDKEQVGRRGKKGDQGENGNLHQKSQNDNDEMIKY